jgi:hypothetical protein
MIYKIITILLSIYIYQTSNNFEGIIKYNRPNTTDSLIYYIGKDKVRIHRKGEFVVRYGNYSDEFMDFKNNRSALYDSKKGKWDFSEASGKIFPIETLSDSMIILKNKCRMYQIDYQNMGFGSTMQDEIFVADGLYYKPPKGCIIQNPFMTNGTGRIALKQIRKVQGENYNSESIMEAVEIIYMPIPDSLLLF